MSDTQETHAAVIAEMRGYSYGMPDSYHVAMSWHDFRVVLARLEAAHKREVAQLRAKIDELRIGIDQYRQYNDKVVRECNGKIGNVAALREALLRCDAIAQLPEVRNEQSIKDMRNIIRCALSAPPRNCDVGTPEEQEDRFNKYCRGSNYCAVCPIKELWNFDNGHRPSCTILWAQMPYEADAQKGGEE